MRKRILSMVMAICMLCAFMTAVHAAEIVDSGTCGENVTWTLDDEGTLTISGRGDMWSYNWHQSAFYNNSSINTVVIENGVTAIGNFAFECCSGLNSILIGESVVSIGIYAFSECGGLTDIQIPDNVTNIGAGAFCDCNNLSEIKLPDNITSIGGTAFGNTSYYLNTENWDDGILYIGRHLIASDSDFEGYMIKPDTLTIAGGAFANNSKLKEIFIPDSVKNIGGSTFSNCTELTSVILPDNLTKIGSSMFEKCVSLSSVIFPNDLTEIASSAFNGCSSLTDITLPYGVTSIESRAFYGCSSLSNIVLPDSIRSVGRDALYGTAYYNNDANWTGEVLYSGNHLIAAKYSLESCDISPGTLTIGDYVFYMRDGLKNAVLPDSIIAIGSYAFCGCALKNLLLPEHMVSIGDNAFEGCLNLNDIEIPGSVKSIGSKAFGSCKALISLKLAEGLESIGENAFEYCTGLTDVLIPASVTKIGDGSFTGCNKLTAINVSAGNTSFVSENGILFNFDKTELIQYPTAKPDKSYSIPSGITRIRQNAFYSCSNLTDIKIPYGVTKIQNYSFSDCTGLINIILPETLESIGEWAFSQCTNLKGLTIPANVSDILFGAFSSCGSVTDVYYNDTENKWNSISIYRGNDPLLNAAIHYNASSIPVPLVTSAEVTASAGEYTFDINLSDIPYTCSVLTALYDNGRLTGFASAPVTSSDTHKTVTVSAIGADSAKVFIWNSADSTKPLCGAWELEME